MDCQAIRQFSLKSGDFFIEYRVIFMLSYLTVLNFMLDKLQCRLLRYAATEHLPAEVNRQLCYRCGQLCISPLLILGYFVLLFNMLSGCDVSETFLFYFVTWLPTFDIHEYVRCWPLSPQLLAHHVMAFGIAICFTDLRALPAPGQPVDPVTLLFLSNIGICWASDFFHVIYRLSTDLDTIKKAYRCYLPLSVLRFVNIFCLWYSAIRAVINGSSLGMVFSGFMAVSYSYNTYMALSFVCRFDVEQYFKTHQVAWGLAVDGDCGSAMLPHRSSVVALEGDLLALGLAARPSRLQAGLRGESYANMDADKSLLVGSAPTEAELAGMS